MWVIPAPLIFILRALDQASQQPKEGFPCVRWMAAGISGYQISPLARHLSYVFIR
jgi:hypothetical protein